MLVYVLFEKGMRVKAISKKEWQDLPDEAQREVYDYFKLMKQRYAKGKSGTHLDLNRASQAVKLLKDKAETLLFSNHSANLVEDWLDDEEDEVWK